MQAYKMKRLLRKNKQQRKGNLQEEEGTRTLHLDTAFENKGFDDMDRIEKGNAMIDTEGIYSFSQWGTKIDSVEEEIRMYGTQFDLFKYSGMGNFKESSDEAGVKIKQRKRRVVFNETSIIGTSSREPQILVGMQVGKHGFENGGDKYHTYANVRNERSRAGGGVNYWSGNIAEKVAANEGSAYGWKTKMSSIKFPTAPDRSFGYKMKRASSEGRSGKSKNRKKAPQKKDSQPYLQKIGGQMDRCISLPNVDTSSSMLSFASYNASFDDTSSLSDISIGDSDMGNLAVTKTVGSIADKQVEYRNHGGDETTTKIESSEAQQEKGKDEETNEISSSSKTETCEVSNIEERTCILKEDTQIREDKVQIEGDGRANTDAALDTIGLDQSKQNSCKSECDSHGNNASVGLRSEAGITPGETATKESDTKSHSDHTGDKSIQLSDVSKAGMGGDNIVCGCILQHSKPPANMKKMPRTCKCQYESENTYKIDDELSERDDQAQQAMKNSSRKQRLVERPLIIEGNTEHTVQIHHSGKGLHARNDTSSESGSIALDNDCNELHDRWSLIPSTVQYTAIRSAGSGGTDAEARSIVDVSSVSEVTTTDLIDDVESRPSTVESTVKRRINMQEIELRLGRQSVSFQAGSNIRDVEVGRHDAAGERPVSRHASKLDRLSQLLRDLTHKRKRVKPSRYTKRESCTENSERKASWMSIEMTDLTATNKKEGTEETKNNLKETKIGQEKGDIKLDSTFILEGAKEAVEQLANDKERLKQEFLIEKSRLENLLDKKRLSHGKVYTTILVLWAIEADMPGEFFDCINKSKMLNALVGEQVYGGRELILNNMYNTESTKVTEIPKKVDRKGVFKDLWKQHSQML